MYTNWNVEVLDSHEASPLAWSQNKAELFVTDLISESIVVIYAHKRAEVVVVDFVHNGETKEKAKLQTSFQKKQMQSHVLLVAIMQVIRLKLVKKHISFT